MLLRRFWTILLLAALALAVQPARAEPSTLIAGAEEVIVRADAQGHERHFDAAIDLLTRALQQYPTYGRLYLSLAFWQEMSGVYAAKSYSGDLDTRRAEFRERLSQNPDIVRDLFDTLGLATTYAIDEQAEVMRRIRDITATDFPVELGEYGPLALPGDPTPFDYTLTDPQLDSRARRTYMGMITTRPIPAPRRFQVDPKYRDNAYRRLLLVYDYDQEVARWYLRFRVIWQSVPGKEEERAELAQQIGRLYAQLAGLARTYTLTYAKECPRPRFTTDGVINVWLSERGEPGGEAVDDNIYFYQVGTPRTATEWVRQLAHEYGHQILPVVGGFEQPEWASNGRMGERLFMHWLLANPQPAHEAHPWLRAWNPEEVREARIIRPLRLFAAQGPEALLQQRGTDARAMEAFVGMALYLELARGSVELSRGNKLLSRVLNSITTPSLEGDGGFMRALERWEITYQDTTLQQPVMVYRLAGLPHDLPIWVYLNVGSWRGEFDTLGGKLPAVTVEVDGKPCAPAGDSAFATGPLSLGWHRLTIKQSGDKPGAISTLRLIRLPDEVAAPKP
jgi:hypothetical protein